MTQQQHPGSGSPMLAPLVCPKCRGEMATYERSGIHVDQCRECRGIFLDRGELEKLVDAEQAAWHAPGLPAGAALPPPPAAAPAPPPVAAPPPAYGAPAPAAPSYGGSAAAQQRDGRRERRDDDDDDDRRPSWGSGYGRDPRPKQRRGFLGELLDFGD